MKSRYEEIVLEPEDEVVLDVSKGVSGDLIVKARKKEVPKRGRTMKTRYEKIVLEAEEEIVLDLSRGISGELTIKARSVYKSEECTENYANPPVPRGYKHACGKWYEGFVIERAKDGSQFVWIPVGGLDSNGTLLVDSFNEKFGRRNYCNDEFSVYKYYERVPNEILKSVKKYGGFYFSRFNISINGRTQKTQSVRGGRCSSHVDFYSAKRLAEKLAKEDCETISSHLPYGAEYDSVLEWFIKSKARARSEIVEDSTNWGIYSNKKNVLHYNNDAGSYEECCTNNVYDLAGNLREWTQESYDWNLYCVRGGSYDFKGDSRPVAYRDYADPRKSDWDFGFRAALCIR